MKFRKKPVVIEAWQVHPNDGHTRQLPPVWLITALVESKVIAHEDGSMSIGTLEGTMRADIGDWIIHGVKNELYPCKPDIFAATYEAADADSAPPAAKAVEMDADKLHAAILNLPPKDTESGWHSDTTRQAYRVGFYAACRAAAELVLAALSKQGGNHG